MATSEWTRSPDFCFKDGTLWLRVSSDASVVCQTNSWIFNYILQVEKVLYCVPAGILQLRSAVFQSILSLKGTDGDCEENPVVLESVSSVDFDHLMRYLFMGYVLVQIDLLDNM